MSDDAKMKRKNSILTELLLQQKESMPMEQGWFQYETEDGRQEDLELHSVLLVASLGYGSTLIVMRTGTWVYSRTKYEDIVEQLVEMQLYLPDYDLLYMDAGQFIIAHKGKDIHGGLANYKLSNKEIH